MLPSQLTSTAIWRLGCRSLPAAQYLIDPCKPLHGFSVGSIQGQGLLKILACLVIPALFKCHLAEGYEFVYINIRIVFHYQNAPHQQKRPPRPVDAGGFLPKLPFFPHFWYHSGSFSQGR